MLRFIVISDTKAKIGFNQNVLKKILQQVIKLNPPPDYAVICGDSVSGSRNNEELMDQLRTFRIFVADALPRCKWIPVVGNHEACAGVIGDQFEKTFSLVYDDVRPEQELDGYHKTVYTVAVPDVRFFVLNAFHKGENYRLASKQLEWFREEASKPEKYKIVLIHSPAFPTGAHYGHCLDRYPLERDAFWNVVDQCGIDLVISGHEHNYSRRVITAASNSAKDVHTTGVTQIICGGGGEKLRNVFCSRQGVVVSPLAKHHFLLVDVLPFRLHATAISHSGEIMDDFTIDK